MVKFNLVSKKSAKIIGSLARKVIAQTTKLKNRLVEEIKTDTENTIPKAISLQEDSEMKEDEDLSNYVTVDGILIKQDFDHLILEENEVDKYTSL